MSQGLAAPLAGATRVRRSKGPMSAHTSAFGSLAGPTRAPNAARVSSRRATRGAFVHSYANKSKTYTPWWKKPATPTPPAVQSVQSENKSNVVEFRRNNKPGAIDDEKVFEKVSKEKEFPAGTLPWKR